MSMLWKDCEGLQRREFLQIGSAGVLGLTLPQLLKAEAKAASTGAPSSQSEKRHPGLARRRAGYDRHVGQ